MVTPQPQEQAGRRGTQLDGLSGMTLGRVLGIEVGMAWSLTIVFLLIFFSLALSWFPRWHPDWSALARWLSALVAAGLFLGSVLLHELSHALVARRNGIPVQRITLFMFGGFAHMEGEPPSPGAEFRIAIIGPVVSIGVGLLSWFGAVAISPQLTGPASADPSAFFSRLGPVASVLTWVGMVNVVLGLFNLIPGFPLDGGKVLRAGLWGATGDRRKATVWSSYIGRGFAALLMGYGIILTFSVGNLAGIWWALIGWMLYIAAKGSYEQLVMRETLEHVPVREVMRSTPVTVPDDMPLSMLVQDHILASNQRSFPVLHDDHLVGMISLEDVRKIARDTWDQIPVTQVMTPAERLSTLSPDDEAADAYQQIATRNVREIPVVENGHVAGVIRREDLVRWISLHRPQRS